MTEISLHDFRLEVSCIYEEEEYSVRDNGAVLRHPRKDKCPRPADNQWTFGRSNSQNGYLYAGRVRVHRIVATAFHGKPPTPEHVVDHIDTNRRNNRPENLRWLTRLENVLKNPITRKRIELICGSIEAFLADPSKLHTSSIDRNFEWMRRVSLQEAQACRERMHLWVKSDKLPSGIGSLGEWVFKYPFLKKLSSETAEIFSELPIGESVSVNSNRFVGFREPAGIIAENSSSVSDLVAAKTPGAAQRKWRIPTEFPCCPQNKEEKSISGYAAKLTVGATFARNNFSTSVVLEAAVADAGQSVYVMCEQAEAEAMKPWSLARITLEDGLYVHTSFGRFFTKEGAEKEFCLARGLEWTGGETFDDYC